MAVKFKAFIAGQWVESGSQGVLVNVNPANTDDIVGEFPSCGKEELDAAVAAAKAAQKKWALVPAPKRGEIIKKAGDLMVDRKEEIARLMTREMGKILIETRGDVQEGIDTAYYMAGEGRRLFGDTVPCELPNKFGMSVRRPIGVTAMICPWNFPMAIPTWKIFPSLMCGNAIILKPASDTPATAVKLFEVLLDAGVPPMLIHLVTGAGSKVGNAILDHPDVNLVSFTGSTQVGRKIAARCGETLKRCSLEMGGKNAQIVLDDADLDLALDGALWGAFGTTGQRCTATSRIILHEKIADEFIARFEEKASHIRVGDGLKPETQMGPLVNLSQQEVVADYVRIGIEEDRAKLVLGGQSLKDGSYAKGYFFQPTIFADVTRNMRIAREEIFGPVVSIIRVKDFEEAIDVLNDTEYGLSSSIYTRNVNLAFRAIRDIEAGITYVNGPTIGAEIQLPFGGLKNTGNGHRESSHTVLDTFSEWKSIYVDYSGRLQRAQIDTD
ncbi:MAG TPA: aldehyde dehydrogenase family protein [Candidatus Sumerlaeota bacterium]|nr:aldehyde dehydrogenase family protein [Candidatus Sumerlaeota bacterium]